MTWVVKRWNDSEELTKCIRMKWSWIEWNRMNGNGVELQVVTVDDILNMLNASFKI